ncbi:hypothetical protein KFL_000030140 [Klebsormidium nitens]|uniref:BZIP domain-containing protein n=1 Tax=Klebsormidium nitens TaxID=105231 RepID=A0A1Y1HH24_KLENI|nr:hypothetical protein KFL_000030140 [Klebsormidium nitens]|eukprot:GAQ77735.1 hypothetical protein KFL_000030140 [Klebsormidium nitens]
MAAMSLDPLDPPRRQRGHRRAQSDFFQYPQGFLEQEEANNLEYHHQSPAEANDHDQSRQIDLLEHIDGHVDLEELQNLLKSRSAENLSLDPKKAKRIIANRQSAARSKEKKVRYIADLENRLQELQSQTTSLNTLMSVLQKDTASLASENKELKQSLQTREAQAQLRDGLNERLRREVMLLKQQAQQLQQSPQHQVAGENAFSQDGFGDQEAEARVADFLNPNGNVDSPTPNPNRGQNFQM